LKTMKSLFSKHPAFMKSLWCQLSVSYTLLTFGAMILLVVMLYGINNLRDFHKALALDNIEKQIESENLTVAHAVRHADNLYWLNKARDRIREKLINLEHRKGTAISRISNSSRPVVYLQISDRKGRRLLSDPVQMPEEIRAWFNKIPQEKKRITRLAGEDGPILIDVPILDDNNETETIGRLRLVFIAEFDLLVQIQSIFNFLFNIWGGVFLFSLPIGITCGLVASRYVTRQLQKMNKVTESWRQGRFQARISLPNDDVLTRHSQYLNDMARDLEGYLNLKQTLAVSDERSRVARELHDTVKQKLFALGLQLATAKTQPDMMEAACEHILEAESITREAQSDLKEIINQLRPVGINEISFYDRIGRVADGFRRRFDVTIELRHTKTVQGNSDATHHVLRIVQESIMNAVRHGKATHIVIEGKTDQNLTTLIVTDNGSGFDTGRKTKGFGFVSMRERIRDLPDGTLEIKSIIDAGTQIKLSWKNEI